MIHLKDALSIEDLKVPAGSGKVTKYDIPPKDSFLYIDRFGVSGGHPQNVTYLEWGKGDTWKVIKLLHGTFECDVDFNPDCDGECSLRVTQANVTENTVEMFYWISMSED